MRVAFLRQMTTAAAVVALFVSLAGCENRDTEGKSPAVGADSLVLERLDREEAFRTGPDSPIPVEKRGSFQGLQYYPVDESLKFTVELKRHPHPQQLRLSTNTGEIRSGLRYGYFDFTVEGQACRLQVYRLDAVEGNGGANLFIPFRDATSGNETYGSGRYIDLTENTTGIYELDFNRAYNPYCAFNSRYSCPLPPAENVLKVPIRAGEKLPIFSGQ